MSRLLLKSFLRSWKHHTRLQIATLVVLSSTFVVITNFTAVTLNLKRVLAHWGESVQLTVFLRDDVKPAEYAMVEKTLRELKDFHSLSYINKEKAAQSFSEQMATYAPQLLMDREFRNPFPASFLVALNPNLSVRDQISRLEESAKKVIEMNGVEDVTYGQGWIENFSSLVNGFASAGWVLVAILTLGSLFIISNSIRSAIGQRREEIEILELVGATPFSIRLPFVLEGVFLGCVSVLIAFAINLIFHQWQLRLIRSDLGFLGLGQLWQFLSPLWFALFFAFAGLIGAAGSYFCVRQINNGWSASEQNR